MNYPTHIKQFQELTLDDYHRITQAREAVFFLEQHVTCPDADEVDPHCLFLWLEDQGRIIAFLRIIPAGIVSQETSIGRVLVEATYRRRGLCRKLMTEALHWIATEWGTQPIRISAQSHLCKFYESLGFKAVSEEYLEAGIPHIKMLKLETTTP